MALWFKIAIPLNVIYWIVFFYLVWRRRWSWPALTVGIFHMLIAGVVSVAPIRSLLDPNYAGYGLGLIHFEGRAVTLPAAVILGWALAAAWTAVSRTSRRWMTMIAVGDILFSMSLSISILISGPQDWTFQLGEHFSVSGVTGLLVLLLFFTLPFIVSAIWAVRRLTNSGNTPPLADNSQDKRADSGNDGKDSQGFRYSVSHF